MYFLPAFPRKPALCWGWMGDYIRSKTHARTNTSSTTIREWHRTSGELASRSHSLTSRTPTVDVSTKLLAFVFLLRCDAPWISKSARSTKVQDGSENLMNLRTFTDIRSPRPYPQSPQLVMVRSTLQHPSFMCVSVRSTMSELFGPLREPTTCAVKQ